MTLLAGNTKERIGDVMHKDCLKELLRLGVTKYRVSKTLGVSWNAVHLWSRDVFKPSPENAKKLEEMLNEIKQ